MKGEVGKHEDMLNSRNKKKTGETWEHWTIILEGNRTPLGDPLYGLSDNNVFKRVILTNMRVDSPFQLCSFLAFLYYFLKPYNNYF